MLKQAYRRAGSTTSTSSPLTAPPAPCHNSVDSLNRSRPPVPRCSPPAARVESPPPNRVRGPSSGCSHRTSHTVPPIRLYGTSLPLCLCPWLRLFDSGNASRRTADRSRHAESGSGPDAAAWCSKAGTHPGKATDAAYCELVMSGPRVCVNGMIWRRCSDSVI